MIRSLPPPRPQPAAAPVAAPRTCPQPAWTAQLRGVSQAASPQPAPRTAQPSRSVSQLRQAFQQAAPQARAEISARPMGKLRQAMAQVNGGPARADAAPMPKRDPMALQRMLKMSPETFLAFQKSLEGSAGKRAPAKETPMPAAVVQTAPTAPTAPVLSAAPQPTQPGQIPPPPPPPPPPSVNAAAPAAGPARAWNKVAAASVADIQQLRDEQSQKLRKEPSSKPSTATPEGTKLINELKERIAARADSAQER